MAEEVRSIVFKNFTDEEFVCSWDSTPYRFAPGKEMYVEDWKANHFAKHLIDRVMNKKGMLTNDQIRRNEFLALALPTEESISVDEALDLNAREEVADTKKKKASKKVETEEEFIGLKKK